MAFQSKNLSVLGYANGFTLWHYATTDAAATVDGSGYFNGASGMLRVGDFVFANASTSGTPENGLLVVVANAGGTVDASNLTPFGASNTD